MAGKTTIIAQSVGHTGVRTIVRSVTEVEFERTAEVELSDGDIVLTVGAQSLLPQSMRLSPVQARHLAALLVAAADGTGAA